MKYLKTNDELINKIHTARQEDYWDFYLEEFEIQIDDYVEAFEWDKAIAASRELWQIADKFPKKWWALGARYKNTSRRLKNEIKERQDDEFTIQE